MSLANARVPLAIVSGLICLVLGFGAGGASMIFFGYDVKPAPRDTSLDGGPYARIPKGDGGGGAAPMPVAGGAGKGKGGGASSSKAQLVALVAKLDQLVGKPLTVELNAEQKKAASELLQGLIQKDELTDDDAKAILDKMLELLKDKRDALETAGYRWPGAGGGGGGLGAPPGIPPNPFKVEANGKRLQSLEATLGKN